MQSCLSPLVHPLPVFTSQTAQQPVGVGECGLLKWYRAALRFYANCILMSNTALLKTFNKRLCDTLPWMTQIRSSNYCFFKRTFRRNPLKRSLSICSVDQKIGWRSGRSRNSRTVSHDTRKRMSVGRQRTAAGQSVSQSVS